ncbi:hypothetical protein [Spirosoma sp. 209]|nr:hypothetical protein [Spirosoma sp. 209]
MKNQTATVSPRLTLKKERIVCLTPAGVTNSNTGKSSRICDFLTIGG